MDINKAFLDAKSDLSKIDPDDLLKGLTNTKNNYLLNKTTDIIEEEKRIILETHFNSIPDGKQKINDFMNRLREYRLVDEVDTLHIGKQTRWISTIKENPTITNGGILVNIVFGDDGILLRIQLWSKSIIQIRMDENIVFQKISYGEQLVLLASNIVNK